jgi:RNAse (barnase) inhibitor barstar
VSKSSREVEVSINLVPFAMGDSFTSDRAVGKWTMEYYSNPEPERIIPALDRFVKVDQDWLTEKAYQLVFFQHVFADNDFIFENAAKQFGNFTSDEKKRLILMAVLTDNDAFDEIIKGRDLRKFYKFAKTIRLPNTSGDINTPDHLDSLWGEFMATGKYEPIRKLVSSLKLSTYMGTLEKIKAGELDKNDKEIMRQAYLEAAWGSALWSLTSNCVQIPQVYKYCIFMYENEDLEDDIKRQLYLILQRAQKQLKEGQE